MDTNRLTAELDSLHAPETVDDIDEEEVFDIIRHIKDPEHPNTLAHHRQPEVPCSSGNAAAHFVCIHTIFLKTIYT